MRNKKVYIIIGVILVLVIALIVAFILFSKKQNKESNQKPEIEKKTLYVYEIEYINHNNKNIEVFDKKIDKKNVKTAKLLSKYECETLDCEGKLLIDQKQDEAFILIKDKNYYLYNYLTSTSTKINYKVEKYTKLELAKYNKDLNSIVFSEASLFNPKIVSYKFYSLSNKKIIFTSLSNLIYNLSYDKSKKQIFDGCTLRNIETGEIIKQFYSPTDDCYINVNSNANYYVVEENYGGWTIYNENFDKMIGPEEDVYTFDDKGNVNLLRDNKIIVYDKTGKVKKETKNYTILGLLDKYFVAVDNGYLKLFTIEEEKEVANFVKWDEKIMYRGRTLPTYGENDIPGEDPSTIYIFINDSSVESDEELDIVQGENGGYVYSYNTKNGKIDKEKSALFNP